MVFGGASPASAQVSGDCEGHDAWLSYSSKMFTYMFLTGGSQSNLNLRVYRSDGVRLWSYFSPDNRRRNEWYHVQPQVVVPHGGYVRFTLIWDVSFASDPTCTVQTEPCCTGANGWGVLDDRGPWGVTPPYLTRSGIQVNAQLPGISRFDFRVRASGVSDTVYLNRTSPFTVSQSRYGGKTVRVTARVTGSSSNPWTVPEKRFSVPALPPPPPPPPPPPCEPVPPAIIC